jgi:outer membrane autotransporter protein
VLDGFLEAGGGGDDLKEVLVALSSLPSNEEAADAIAQMVPVLVGSGTIAVTQVMDATMGMVNNRLGSGGPRSGAAGDDSRYERGPLWLKPFGSYADQDTRSGTPGFEADTMGIGLGGDLEANDRLLLGAAVAWSDTEIDGDTLSSNRLDAETYQLVVYGDYALNETDFVESYAVAGWNDNETRRQISVGGLTRQARGDYNSFFTRFYTGVGRHYHTSDSWTFAPVVNLRYTYIDEDSYIEKGAGSLNLAVDDNDADSLILGLDGVATYRFGDNQGYTMTLRTGIGFDVLTDETAVTSTFAGGGGAFTTTGAEPDELTYRGGIGFNAAPTDRMSVHLDYEFEGRSDYQSHGGSLNVRWQF